MKLPEELALRMKLADQEMHHRFEREECMDREEGLRARLAAAEARNRKLVEAVHAVKQGDCWCPVGIGHPLLSSHLGSCVALRAALDQTGKEET